MSAKVVLVLCAQALFMKTAFSQCIGRGAIAAPALAVCGSSAAWGAGVGLAAPGLGLAPAWAASGCAGNGVIGDGIIGNNWAGLAALDFVPTSGGTLPVSSLSALAPTGLVIDSENVYEGALSVAGELPFLSAVALEGVLASGGAGVVNHACGSGVGIVAENFAPAAGYGAGYGLGSGYGAAYGLGAGYGAAGAYGLGAAYGNGAAAFAPAALGRGCGARGCGCGLY